MGIMLKNISTQSVLWRNVKKNECYKNCSHFGWEMVSGIESIPNPFVNICLIKGKRKSENAWCKEWVRNKNRL